MADPVTPNLGLDLPVRGEYVGTWDTISNPNYTTIDNAIGGVASIAVSAGTITLTAAQAACRYLNFTGSLTGNCVVMFPTGMGGRKAAFFGNVTFNGFGLYLRSPSDNYGLVALSAWYTPLVFDVWPGFRLFWDYGAAPPGTLASFGGNGLVPPGWLLCDGRAVSRLQYGILLDTIGGAYGAGDGSTTFNVPDYRGRVDAGADAMMGGASAGRLFNWGPYVGGGASQAALAIANMPYHDHGYSQSPHGHGVSDPQHEHGGVPALGSPFGGSGGYAVTGGTINTAPAPTGIGIVAANANINFAGQGGGAAFNTIPPTLTVNKLIRC
jgi:microcystin-dependent protein